MNTRIALYALLTLVAGCAAVLSFAALRDLALVCGFVPWSAPLLPLVIDAGAAAGTLAWLTGGIHDSVDPSTGRARRFGRALALVLLTASVAGNGLGHGLAAYGSAPPWWLVVAVSGVAPAVLGAVVHLAVVAAQDVTAAAVVAVNGLDDTPRDDGMVAERDPSSIPADPPEFPPSGTRNDQAQPGSWAAPGRDPVQVDDDNRAAELIERGAGRRRLARELQVSEHTARRLLDASRNGASGVTR